MNQNNEKMNQTNIQLCHQIALSNQYSHNPYARMAQTTDSVKADIRKTVFLPYSGITNNTPTCMYTGRRHQKVRCAHILPKSTISSTLLNLSLDANDVNNPRNLMWLCPGIEDAFDTMKLSFVRKLLPGFVEGYVMLIWDESCLNSSLDIGDDQTIRDVYEENKCLNFTITGTDGSKKPHIVFKRCLANQAIWCHHSHIGEYLESIWTYGDFSSVDEAVHQKLVKNEYIHECNNVSYQRN